MATKFLYHLNGSATDSSGNGFDLSLTGSGLQYVTGKFGQGIKSDLVPGTQFYLFSASAMNGIGTSDFTLEFFVKFNTGYSTQVYFYNGVNDATFNMYVAFQSSGNLLARFNSFGMNFSDNVPTSYLTDGQFHHVAYVKSSTTLSVYIDGLKINDHAYTPFSFVDGHTLQIGNFQPSFGNYPLASTLDELRFSTDVIYSGASFTVPNAPFGGGGTPPTITITSSSTSPVHGTFSATMTASEPVSVTGSLIVTNASITNIQVVDSSHVTFDVNPITTGLDVTVKFPAGGATSIATGLTNAESNTLTRSYVAYTNPTVALSTTATSPVNSAYSVTATFSEAVTFLETDITISNGDISDFATSDSIIYTFTVTPQSVGDVTTQILADKATSMASGLKNTASNTLTLTYELVSTAPTVVITTSAVSPVSGAFTATATFSEDVSFTSSGITHTNSMITNFTAVSNKVYTFNLLPSYTGNVTAKILAGQAMSLGSGLYNEESNTLTIAYQAPVAPSTTKNHRIHSYGDIQLIASGSIDVGGAKITGVADPVGDTDAVPKKWALEHLSSGGALTDDSFAVSDVTDNTKKVKFDVGGTTGTITTIATSQTVDRTITLPNTTDTLVGKATTDTLTNKSLSDSTTSIVGASDNTKKLKFDMSNGTTGTTTTVASYQTADRIIRLPDADTTLVGHNTTNNLTNKSLVDFSTAIVDLADQTKKIKFDAAGTTGTATTIASSQTSDRTITLPDVTGTLITTGDTGTVTSAMILNGTIVDTDISATASIADTKLATISTAGKVSNSATTATSLNTASAIVARDASGNFTAGTITASLNGNASTVTTNANLTGPVTSVGNATSISNSVITSAMIVDATIVNGDISLTAAIDRSKIASSANAYRLVTNGATGALSEASAITASRALISDSNGIPTHSTTTSTELAKLAGFVGNIANTTLSNLDNPTAINQDLLPAFSAGANLGSSSLPFNYAHLRGAYLGVNGTQGYLLTPSVSSSYSSTPLTLATGSASTPIIAGAGSANLTIKTGDASQTTAKSVITGDISISTGALTLSGGATGTRGEVTVSGRNIYLSADSLITVQSKIAGLSDPTNDQDAVNKRSMVSYVSANSWLRTTSASSLSTLSALSYFGSYSGDYDIAFMRNNVEIMKLQSTKVLFDKDLEFSASSANIKYASNLTIGDDTSTKSLSTNAKSYDFNIGNSGRVQEYFGGTHRRYRNGGISSWFQPTVVSQNIAVQINNPTQVFAKDCFITAKILIRKVGTTTNLGVFKKSIVASSDATTLTFNLVQDDLTYKHSSISAMTVSIAPNTTFGTLNVAIAGYAEAVNYELVIILDSEQFE